MHHVREQRSEGRLGMGAEGEKVRERLKLWSQPSYSFNTVAINHNQPGVVQP